MVCGSSFFLRLRQLQDYSSKLTLIICLVFIAVADLRELVFLFFIGNVVWNVDYITLSLPLLFMVRWGKPCTIECSSKVYLVTVSTYSWINPYKYRNPFITSRIVLFWPKERQLVFTCQTNDNARFLVYAHCRLRFIFRYLCTFWVFR